jgi:hypothetical protein
MISLLLFHASYCIFSSYIAHFLSCLILMHSLDRVFVEPEPEIRKGVWWSTSAIAVDANIVVIKTSPGASNHHP